MFNNSRVLNIDISGSDFDLLIINANINESISNNFDINATCFSKNLSLNSVSFIGKKATIILCLNQKKYFNGIIYKFQSGRIEENIRYYFLHIVSYLYFLSFNCVSHIYQNKESFQIVNEIHKKFSIKPPKLQLKRGYLQKEYNVQYDESYYHYIQRLLDKDGIFYYFVHTHDEHQLILTDDSLTAELLPYNVGMNPNKLSNCFFTTFEKIENYYPIEFHGMDYNYDNLQNKYFNNLKRKRNYEFSCDSFYQFCESNSETAHNLEMYLQNLAEIFKVQGEYYLADSHWPYFDIAKIIELNQTSDPSQHGKYFIIAIHHIIHDFSGMQNKSGGFHYQNKLLLTSANISYRPNVQLADPKLMGLHLAEVVGPEDNEVHTDRLGRVKVKFQWMQNKQDSQESCWIPVAQNIAGNNYGMWSIPRVGNLVIVQFLNGNPERPIITGSLHHSKNSPPFNLPSEKNFWGMKSYVKDEDNSENKTLQNAFYFNDTPETQAVYLNAQKDFLVNIGKNNEVKIQGNKNIEVNSGDYTIKILQGQCNIKAKNNITLEVGASKLEISNDLICLKAPKIKLNSN